MITTTVRAMVVITTTVRATVVITTICEGNGNENIDGESDDSDNKYERAW